MAITNFGKTAGGADVMMYTLKNAGGMEVDIISLGATLRAVRVPDKNGVIRDVLLGYDTPAEYEAVNGFLGTVIGRNGNRIAGAQVTIEGTTYQLEANENENNLHSGSKGFHTVLWTATEADDAHVVLTYHSPDGEQGFPGNMDVVVTYTLTDAGELGINYKATTDKTTVANFTNHAYFNLNGQDSGVAEDQKLQIFASHYIPVKDEKCIPTGVIAEVANTPLDFRQMTVIGDRIRDDYDQLKYVGGYDHCYIADKEDNAYGLVAVAQSDVSGIRMEVFTDALGIQFYAGNFIGEQSGKDGATYNDRHGYALETGYAPNSANETNFKQPIFVPGEVYETKTTYQFSVM